MKIHLLHNKSNVQYNLNRWNINDCPILLIIGLSGSGKTTYAKKIAKTSNVQLVSFDVLKFLEDAPPESQEILKCFLKEHPEICNLINSHWSKTDSKFTNDVLYNYFCNVFFDFLMDYCQKRQIRIVLEGIQLFIRLHPYKTVGMPLVVIGSSSLQSHIYKLKRDYILEGNHFNFRKYIYQTYLYHIKQRFYINKYLFYYEVLDMYYNEKYFFKNKKRKEKIIK